MTQCITKDYLFDHVIDVECGDGTYQEAILLEDIYDAPTVDAVEVVRCKDCKHYDGWCAVHLQPRLDADFCNHGERGKE